METIDEVVNTRVVEVQRWETVSMLDLKPGDVFRMWEDQEKTNPVVDACGSRKFMAKGAPFIDESGTYGIQSEALIGV